ncbi:MAG TPA: hypothetical protein VMW17_24800 [Candidatus Binatia bacterium]|nr:hypothetical protein [Candidatus Binatia bacterium]
MGNGRRLRLAFLAGSLLLGASEARAGGKISIDDTKWISIGLGGRTSFSAVEDATPAGSGFSKDFNLDNARIYISGQVHKYLKFELNTECAFCGNGSLQDFVLLDAIAKIELTPWFNIWAGRLLVPAERQEMNGPFYSATYDAYKTPFYPADFSVKFGSGGAGVYERSQGATLWGAAGPKGAFQYALGVFDGLRSSSGSGPNQHDNPLFGTRLAYNFLNVEDNPGYYTSGTYYGGGGDIFTLGLAMQYQEEGSGSFKHPGDFFGVSGDLLFEKPMSGAGVFTFTGEYKHFESNYSTAAFGDSDAFLMFDGDAFWLAGLYLVDQKVGIGKFQPYVRYSDVLPDHSTDRSEIEVGLNYIVDGHNARMSLFYEYGDIATKGLNYAPGAKGDDVSAVKLAIQLQI